MINYPTKVKFVNSFPDFNVKNFNVEEYNKDFYSSNVIINARARRISYPLHWGPLSLKCVQSGVEFYSSRNCFYAVDPQTYLLFNEGKMYSSYIDSPEEVDSFTLNFAPHFAKSVIHSLKVAATAPLDDPFHIPAFDFNFTEKLYSHDARLTPVLDQIRDLSCDMATNRERINEGFAQVLETLMAFQQSTNAEISSLEMSRHTTRIELFDRLTRAKDFIYSSFNQNINLAEMADVACLNQFYFLRQFKKAFKLTPHQFLTNRRLEIASALLIANSKSVSEVCRAVGFSDLASFSRLFKRKFGVSPLRFEQ